MLAGSLKHTNFRNTLKVLQLLKKLMSNSAFFNLMEIFSNLRRSAGVMYPSYLAAMSLTTDPNGHCISSEASNFKIRMTTFNLDGLFPNMF